MHLLKFAVVVVVGAALAAIASPAPHGRPPRPSLDPPSLLRDGRSTRRRIAPADVAWHGGVVTAATGDQVAVYVSDSYPPDQNPPQQWADFFAGLLHGSELSLLTAYI